GLDDAVTVGAVALQQSHDRSLARATSADDFPSTRVLVHEPRLAADEGLIDFDGAGHTTEGAGLHGEPDAVEHEPRGLLSDADGARQFCGRNTVLVIGDNPDGGEPFVEAKRRILKDRADLDRELTLRMLGLALPQFAGGDEPHFVRTAVRAD